MINLPACVMSTAYIHCLMRAEEDARSGNRVTNACELPRGCQEMNMKSLQNQQVPVTTEPSLHPAASTPLTI